MYSLITQRCSIAKNVGCFVFPAFHTLVIISDSLSLLIYLRTLTAPS